MKKAQIKTPLGITLIEGDTNGISKISVEEDAEVFSTEIPSALKEASLQLREYFQGKRKEFTFKINPKGTDFQQRVWQALLKISFGQNFGISMTLKYFPDSILA